MEFYDLILAYYNMALDINLRMILAMMNISFEDNILVSILGDFNISHS